MSIVTAAFTALPLTSIAGEPGKHLDELIKRLEAMQETPDREEEYS